MMLQHLIEGLEEQLEYVKRLTFRLERERELLEKNIHPISEKIEENQSREWAMARTIADLKSMLETHGSA